MYGSTRFLLLIFLVACTSLEVLAQRPQWTRLDPIAYGDHRTVAITASGRMTYAGGRGGTYVSLDTGRSAVGYNGPAVTLLASTVRAGTETWIVGENGWVMRSSGDSAWSRRQVTANVTYEDIAFGTPDVGLLVGWARRSLRGLMLRTTDAGATWLPIELPDTTALSAVELARGIGLAVNRNGEVLRSVDDGVTWQTAQQPPATIHHALEDVAIGENGIAIAVGGSGTGATSAAWIMRSTDAGRSWAEAAYDRSAPGLFDVEVTTAARVIAIGRNGAMLASDDSGATWRAVPIDFVPTATSFRDSTFGAAVGKDGLVRHSSDGGRSWRTRSMHSAGRGYLDVALHRNGSIVAVGVEGTLVVSDILERNLRGITLPTREALRAVAWTPSGRWIACGDAGIIVRQRDTGIAVGRLGSGLYTRLNDLVFASDGTGYAVAFTSKGPVVIRSTDGGERWDSVSAPILDRELFAVAAGDDLWVAGAGGRILVSSDRGVTWSDRSYYGQDILRSIAIVDRDHIVIAGAEVMIRTTDRGRQWTQGNQRLFTDVEFADARVGLSAHGANEIEQTTDGGITWTAYGVTTNWFVGALSIAGTRVVAVTAGGEIIGGDLTAVASTAPEATAHDHGLIVREREGRLSVSVAADEAPMIELAVIDVLGRRLCGTASSTGARELAVQTPISSGPMPVLVTVTLADGARRVVRLVAGGS